MSRPALSLPIILTLAWHFSACLPTFMLRPLITSAAVPNWVPVHATPQPGDYAIHELSKGGRIRYRVESVAADGTVEFSQQFISAPLMAQGLKGFAYHVYCDAEGRVLRAEYVDSDDPLDREGIRVARPGDFGYIERPQDASGDIIYSQKISVPAGEFHVREFRLLTFKSNNGFYQSTGTQIQFLHRRVPFLIVELKATLDSELPAARVANVILNYVPTNPADAAVRAFLLAEAGAQNLENSAQLIEMGSAAGPAPHFVDRFP
ncbi:MAG: hypothetical protein K1X75_01220 [Leptospirales bacterium]|nr:hypothetical protein [Leptospirales bacterium]